MIQDYLQSIKKSTERGDVSVFTAALKGEVVKGACRSERGDRLIIFQSGTSFFFPDPGDSWISDRATTAKFIENEKEVIKKYHDKFHFYEEMLKVDAGSLDKFWMPDRASGIIETMAPEEFKCPKCQAGLDDAPAWANDGTVDIEGLPPASETSKRYPCTRCDALFRVLTDGTIYTYTAANHWKIYPPQLGLDER